MIVQTEARRTRRYRQHISISISLSVWLTGSGQGVGGSRREVSVSAKGPRGRRRSEERRRGLVWLSAFEQVASLRTRQSKGGRTEEETSFLRGF